MPKHQTSEISLKTSDLDLMLKHQKWQHWQLPMRNEKIAQRFIHNQAIKRF